MKKIFSILFALLIILSGMHLSVATHICGDKVAAVKWSFSGEIATCGMETSEQQCSSHKTIASNCCKNQVSNYETDRNFIFSSYKFAEATKTLLRLFYLPVHFGISSLPTLITLLSNASPPGIAPTSAVSLAEICVFRI